MTDERVWLRHADHSGTFQCPAEAVADWLTLGWAVMDGPPPEPLSPVVAERVAQEAERARLAELAAAEQAAAPKSTKPARRGETTEE